MSAVKVPGTEIIFGGSSYILAPLNVATVKQYQDQIKAVYSGSIPDIVLVAKLVHASLRRNYPDMALEEVEEFIDYGNFYNAWEALMNLSGLAVQVGKTVRRVQEIMESSGLKA